MKCPYCETDLRIDGEFVNSHGLIKVVVACQNDADRQEQCIPETEMLISLHEESGEWVLRDYGD